jgi:FkbM family methyltransferase
MATIKSSRLVRIRSDLRRVDLRDKPYYVWRPRQALRRFAPGAHDRSPDGIASIELPWGGPVYCWPGDAIGSALARTGVYDLTVSEVLARLTAPGEFAIDAGANIGYMTALLASRAGASGRVLAFEPHPGLARMLHINAARWSHLWAPIEVRETAVSDRPGTAPLTIDEQFESNRGTASLSSVSAARRQIAEVRLERLDQVIGEHDVGVLKIDVEGHELQALEGAGATIGDRRIRDIVFEEHRPSPTPVSELLERAGYTLCTLDRSFFGPRLRPPFWRSGRGLDGTSLLATVDLERARNLLKPRGWVVLRSGAGRTVGSLSSRSGSRDLWTHKGDP